MARRATVIIQYSVSNSYLLKSGIFDGGRCRKWTVYQINAILTARCEAAKRLAGNRGRKRRRHRRRNAVRGRHNDDDERIRQKRRRNAGCGSLYLEYFSQTVRSIRLREGQFSRSFLHGHPILRPQVGVAISKLFSFRGQIPSPPSSHVS